MSLIRPFSAANGPPPRQLLPFMAWTLSGAWLALGITGVVSVVAGVVEILSAMLLGWVVDAVVAAGPQALLQGSVGTLVAALVFFVVLRPLIFGANSYMQSLVVAPNVFNLVLSRLHRWTLGQDVSFFDNDFAGRIAQKEMQTARAVTDVVVEVVHTVLFGLASVIGALVLVAAIDWRVALVLIVWIAAYAVLIRVYLPRIRVKSAARAGARAMITGQIVDTVTNVKTVKLFAHDDHEDRAALDAMGRFRRRALEWGRVAVEFRVLLMFLAGLLPVLLVGTALLFWEAGAISAGDIAATGTVSFRLAQMVGWVSHMLMGMSSNIGEIENGMHTLTPPHGLVDRDDATELEVTSAQISFEAVTFTYGRRDVGLRDVTLQVQPGEKLGIVGASGAGKSTLVAMLLRLYDAEKGRILIDGQDVSRVSQVSLRNAIGTVTQETAMFNRSARDNILYGRPGVDDAALETAARQAEAHDFILELEDFQERRGYDAHLGERGVKLSGGQRQRIALARAILKDAPILVLDEATSALDSEVEAQIQAALTRVMQGKTVLAIAHRLSTIAQMDRIIVLDEGRIVEEGTHAALLAQGELYARYWQRQSGGFLGLPSAAE